MPDFNQNNVIIGVGALKVDGVSVGYTSGGVVLTAKSDRMEKEVDQSYAPIGIHKVKESYDISTELAEATLDNLKLVWEQTEDVDEETDVRTLSLGMNPAVIEHTLEFIGKSPEGYERTFTVYKAVVWEVGKIEHKKNALTTIPVTFRILPDTAKPAGKEYGKVVDNKTA